MTTKMKTQTPPVARRLQAKPPATLPSSIPWTTAERLQRIETMGQRITGYVQFMCKVGQQSNTSGEATDLAVAAFYEQMVIVERQLARIQENFQLE